MRTILTIRTDAALRKALERRARAEGRTVSELAREILRDALQEQPMVLKTGHLRGRLHLRRVETESRRQALREAAGEPDPVIEAYKRSLDVSLLQENLRKTPTERVAALMESQRLAVEARRAGRMPGPR